MEIYHADILIDQRHILAEGPIWNKARKALQYVDITGCTLHTFDVATGHLTTERFTQNVGCFALRQGGGMILGLAAGVYLRSENPLDMHKFPGLDFDPLVRANDGKCDPKGRFWFGTADQADGIRRSELFCIPGDGRCIKMLDGIECSNGLAFLGDQVYFIDSPSRELLRFTLDEETMTLQDRRVAIKIDPAHGVADGMTWDEEGMLWVAHWDGGFVGRYNPKTAEMLAKVIIPASRCSSCCFGGDDMQTLYITSASVDRGHEPDAGKIFSIHLPYRGVESPLYIA